MSYSYMVTPPSTLGFGLKSKQLRTIKQLEVSSHIYSVFLCMYSIYIYIYIRAHTCNAVLDTGLGAQVQGAMHH